MRMWALFRNDGINLLSSLSGRSQHIGFQEATGQFFMSVLLASDVHFLHQSERIRCLRYSNTLHYNHVEWVKGLIYGLCSISQFGMLCQVVCFLAPFVIFSSFVNPSFEELTGFLEKCPFEWNSIGQQWILCFQWNTGYRSVSIKAGGKEVSKGSVFLHRNNLVPSVPGWHWTTMRTALDKGQDDKWMTRQCYLVWKHGAWFSGFSHCLMVGAMEVFWPGTLHSRPCVLSPAQS